MYKQKIITNKKDKVKIFFPKPVLKNKIAGKTNIVITIVLKTKKPEILRICKNSVAQEKL